MFQLKTKKKLHKIVDFYCSVYIVDEKRIIYTLYSNKILILIKS